MISPAFTYVSRLGEALPHCDLWRHHSGAMVVHRQDASGPFAFAIGFPTPARDDSGLTHILEHMVFRGSVLHGDDALYATLRSGSLAFHLNASTGPECTSYHCATPIAKDAHRLEQALLAAVFQPLLDEKAFREEAFDLRNDKAGVVYNEMQGHLAHQAARLEHKLRERLFAGTPSAHCYGGKPSDIRQLGVQALRDYHRHYYHPSRALVLLTGPDETGRRFAQLDRAFQDAGGSQIRAPATRAPHIVQGQEADHHYWGMIFPDDLSQMQKRLLAEAILLKAQAEFGPNLDAKSGFVDGLQPYVALYWRGRGQVDLPVWAQDMSASMMAHVIQRIRAAHSDDEADFRLPTALHIWPRLCAAHLRGHLAEAFVPPPQSWPDLPARLGQIARSLPHDLTVAGQSLPPIPRSDRVAQKALGYFTPLPLSGIAAAPLDPAPSLENGVILCPTEADGYLRIALFGDAAALSDQDIKALPALAASASAALDALTSCHNAGRAGLLIEKRLHMDELSEWLDRCAAWFDTPTPGFSPKASAQHVAAEIHLRAAFSAQWRRINRLIGLAPQFCGADACDLQRLAWQLRGRLAAATTAQSAVALLRPWVSRTSAAPMPFPPRFCRQSRIVTGGPSLFIVGLGWDLQDLCQAQVLVARKAIETDVLWPHLRVSGGSYGVRSSLQEGIVTFTSIHDPQGPKSLTIMEGAGAWLADHAEDRQILHRAKLAALAEELRPKPASQRLREALLAQPSSKVMERVLQMTSDDLRQIAMQMTARLPQSQGLLLASQQTLELQGLRPDH